MARVGYEQEDYTVLSDRDIAASGIGTSPTGIAAYRSLQRAVYEDQPADTADAQAAAEQASQAAAAADAAAVEAAVQAEQGKADAATAQGRADDAYALADAKVARDVGPVFAAPLATPSRNALPAYAGGGAAALYDPAEVSALKAQVAALTATVAALVVDLRGNGALTDA